MAEIKPLLNPWVPMSDPIDKKVIGKALEEQGECTQILARCFIQGVEESEPVTGKPNRRSLEEEIADIYATAAHVIRRFKLDGAFIVDRADKKYAQLNTWFYEMN